MKNKLMRGLIVSLALAMTVVLTGAASVSSDTPAVHRIAVPVPAGVPYNRALRDTAAIQIYAAYVSFGGPQYATGANMDQAIKAANIFVEKLTSTGLK